MSTQTAFCLIVDTFTCTCDIVQQIDTDGNRLYHKYLGTVYG
jgi:hypothetical protein